MPIHARMYRRRLQEHLICTPGAGVQGDWLLMLETDYVFVKVPDVPTAVVGGEVLPVAFPFGYITPAVPHLQPIIRDLYKEEQGPVEDIQGTGPAPCLLTPAHLNRVSHLQNPVHTSRTQWTPSTLIGRRLLESRLENEIEFRTGHP